MKLLGASCVSILLLKCLSASSSISQLTAASVESVEGDTPSISAQHRRSIVGRPRSSIAQAEEAALNESPERVNHSFDEYNDVEASQTLLIDNPLDGRGSITEEIRRLSGISSSGGNASGTSGANRSVAARLFPFVLEKPVPPPRDSEHEESSSASESEPASSVDELDANDLMNMIPERFVVNETSGQYQFYEEDEFLTSSEIMKKRYALYQLLSEVYMLFDTFDFAGFSEFLANTPAAAKEHQDFRYHLIENLAARSLKTSNPSTWAALARFIVRLDQVAVAKTVGKYEQDTFEEFESRLKSQKGKSKQFPEPINNVLSEFLAHEKLRLNPLHESIIAHDYAATRAIIARSQRAIYISTRDFVLLLDQPCSSDRYYFLCWAIENGHMNAHDKMGEQRVTPLMLAAMSPKWSNDVVKAILFKAPSAIAEVDLNGNNALKFAKNNHLLQKRYRKPMIEMLSLAEPTNEALNAIIMKHVDRTRKL